MAQFTPEEELLLMSVVAMSGINRSKNDHESKYITDRYSAWTLRRIGRRYQIYSTEEEENWDPNRTVTIMRLCDSYFSMEYACLGNSPVKIRWMESLDFKAMIEKEKQTFSKMDTEK